jgi:hypothetical protein
MQQYGVWQGCDPYSISILLVRGLQLAALRFAQPLKRGRKLRRAGAGFTFAKLAPLLGWSHGLFPRRVTVGLDVRFENVRMCCSKLKQVGRSLWIDECLRKL